MAKNNPNYVSNVQFFQEMIEYLNDRRQKLDNGEGEPTVPQPIAEKIMKICNRLSNRPNFRGYSFKEDMISAAILNCFKYIHKFDPEKSSNPFSYFTQVAKNAFIQKIKTEKKQNNIKSRYIQSANFDISSMTSIQEQDDDEHFPEDIVEHIQEFYSNNEDKSMYNESEKTDSNDVRQISPLNQLWSEEREEEDYE